MAAAIGAMLKCPMAMNRTWPDEPCIGSAMEGVTVMLCNCRPCIDMKDPPQEMVSNRTGDINRMRIKVDNLRIRHLQVNCREGQENAQGEEFASKYATPAVRRKKLQPRPGRLCRAQFLRAVAAWAWTEIR